jgi:hypothetical protein
MAKIHTRGQSPDAQDNHARPYHGEALAPIPQVIAPVIHQVKRVTLSRHIASKLLYRHLIAIEVLLLADLILRIFHAKV